MKKLIYQSTFVLVAITITILTTHRASATVNATVVFPTDTTAPTAGGWDIVPNTLTVPQTVTTNDGIVFNLTVIGINGNPRAFGGGVGNPGQSIGIIGGNSGAMDSVGSADGTANDEGVTFSLAITNNNPCLTITALSFTFTAGTGVTTAGANGDLAYHGFGAGDVRDDIGAGINLANPNGINLADASMTNFLTVMARDGNDGSGATEFRVQALTFNYTTVPEPSVFALSLLSTTMLGLRRRRKGKNNA